MKIYAVINKSTFVGDAYVICTEIKSAKNAFDNYTVNPGRTVLIEAEMGEDFGWDDKTNEIWGGEVIADKTTSPEDWSTLPVFDEEDEDDAYPVGDDYDDAIGY